MNEERKEEEGRGRRTEEVEIGGRRKQEEAREDLDLRCVNN